MHFFPTIQMEPQTSLRKLIDSTRDMRIAIKELEKQLSALNTPTYVDTSILPSIYSTIQEQMQGEFIRDQRLSFVFIAVYLYSPASIYGSYSLKAGLRSKIGNIIGRSKGEVSSLLTEAKFRYEKLQGFNEKIDKILAKYLQMQLKLVTSVLAKSPNMSTDKKLVERFKRLPRNFTFDEMDGAVTEYTKHEHA